MLPGAIASGRSPPSGPSMVASTLSVSGMSNSWTTPYNIYVYSNTTNSTVGATLVDSSLNITTPSYTSSITPVVDKYYYSVVYAANARGSSFGTQSEIKQVAGYFPITVNNAVLGTDYTITNYAGRTFYTFKSARAAGATQMSITTTSDLVVDYLALGGGGGGGGDGAGGGGAGGLQQAVGATLTAGTRTITIGDGGGGGGSSGANGTTGFNTTFGTVTALGGGGGGGGISSQPGLTGGCGGGSSYSATTVGGTGTQGRDGGAGGGGGSGNDYSGGGGGGLGSVGLTAVTRTGGNGGTGITYNNGTTLQLGGGGGGGSGFGTGGLGGVGVFGGGTGGRFSTPASAAIIGASNTGGGGGGGAPGGFAGAKGGSGIFIISYPQFTTTAPFTKSIVNGVEYFKFTGSGTITTYGSMLMEYFAIGGGGSGGGDAGGGGGAGGLQRGFMTLPAGAYPLTIGIGGNGVSGVKGQTGGDTKLSSTTINALGGGGGGIVGVNASSGGCGGGSGDRRPGTTSSAGTGTQGFGGGLGLVQSGPFNGGGGGGLVSVGSSATVSYAGNGGGAITFNGVQYGGGGGAGGVDGTGGGTGGGGGAGNGGYGAGGNGVNATSNTGSGGGGAANSATSGAGGSGVFIASFFVPTMPTGLNLWLDANDVLGTGTNPASGTIVTTWKDKSGLGNDGTGAGNPVLSNLVVNGQPGVLLNGTSQYFTGSTINTGNTYSAFAVATLNSSAGTSARLLGFYTPSSGDGAQSIAFVRAGQGILGVKSSTDANTIAIPAYSTPFYALALFNGSSNTPYMNGVAGSTKTTLSSSNFTYTKYAIGVQAQSTPVSAEYWSGYISEILIYNAALSDYDRLRVETYLKNKWSIA